MADYDAGCRDTSISTKCRMRKSTTSSSLPISRRGNASVSRRRSRRSSKNLAKTCKSGSHRPVAPRSRIHAERNLRIREQVNLELRWENASKGPGIDWDGEACDVLCIVIFSRILHFFVVRLHLRKSFVSFVN